eukprot:scaffold670232_cov46-Prasinocladus_malaysianus.AAC.1
MDVDVCRGRPLITGDGRVCSARREHRIAGSRPLCDRGRIAYQHGRPRHRGLHLQAHQAALQAHRCGAGHRPHRHPPRGQRALPHE